MADLFKEVIPSILQTNENVLKDELDVKEYAPFIVNRSLSYHMDCILYVNEMNIHNQLDKDMQYQYLLNSIRKRKRPFQSWQKVTTDKRLACIKEYFGYSNVKAMETLNLLSDEQIEQLQEKTNKGGLSKKS
jgi:hypothetical protein